MDPQTSKKYGIKITSETKREVYLALEYVLQAKPLGRILGILLMILIAVNALPVGYDTAGHSEAYARGFFIFHMLSAVVFAIEYGLRIWVADIKYPRLGPVQSRIRYMRSIMGIIDLLSFLPMLLVWVGPFSGAIAEATKVIRLVRLVKISRYMRGLRTIYIVMVKRRQEIVAAFMVLTLVCIASSVLIYEVEHPVQPDKFDSVFTGIYWALTTMTSTGYGDLAPITPLGRLIGSITMILSIAVVAIPAGIFSAGFVAEFRSTDSMSNQNEDDGS